MLRIGLDIVNFRIPLYIKMHKMLDNAVRSNSIFNMNKLPDKKRAQILSMLCEGTIMRAISRICDVSLNTVSKLLVDAGEACMELHDELVWDVKTTHVQADEVWSFNYCKDRAKAKAKAAPADAGSVWTWTAIDQMHKMIVSYFVGDRSGQSAIALMDDLQSRVVTRLRLSTDGWHVYAGAVEGTFGEDVDYSQLVKIYGKSPEAEKRYSPPECIGTEVRHISGVMINPCTSHVERSNLSLRMHNRRFTRLTNAHSKKFANHCYMIAIYTFFYNFVRPHLSLDKATPAIAAGLLDTYLSFNDVLALIDAKQSPKKRGPYKKRAAD